MTIELGSKNDLIVFSQRMKSANCSFFSGFLRISLGNVYLPKMLSSNWIHKYSGFYLFVLKYVGIEFTKFMQQMVTKGEFPTIMEIELKKDVK